MSVTRATLALALLLLGACASTHKTRVAEGGPAPAAAAPLDGSYDWHVLEVMKFGTMLKQSPLPLHEVLLFRDAAQGGDAENKDCHALDGAPPRFLGRQPDDVLLCFDHDRLNRIEAVVKLQASQASAVAARACASWLNTAEASQATGHCEGREGDVGFSAHLAADANDVDQVFTVTVRALANDAGHLESVP